MCQTADNPGMSIPHAMAGFSLVLDPNGEAVIHG